MDRPCLGVFSTDLTNRVFSPTIICRKSGVIALLNVQDRDVSLGLTTACVGGGMGGAMITEPE